MAFENCDEKEISPKPKSSWQQRNEKKIADIFEIIDDMDLSENDFHTLQNVKSELNNKLMK